MYFHWYTGRRHLWLGAGEPGCLLADRTAAQAAQLLIEYDPQPPFDCGARPNATDEVMGRVIEYDAPRQ